MLNFIHKLRKHPNVAIGPLLPGVLVIGIWVLGSHTGLHIGIKKGQLTVLPYPAPRKLSQIVTLFGMAMVGKTRGASPGSVGGPDGGLRSGLGGERPPQPGKPPSLDSPKGAIDLVGTQRVQSIWFGAGPLKEKNTCAHAMGIAPVTSWATAVTGTYPHGQFHQGLLHTHPHASVQNLFPDSYMPCANQTR